MNSSRAVALAGVTMASGWRYHPRLQIAYSW